MAAAVATSASETRGRFLQLIVCCCCVRIYGVVVCMNVYLILVSRVEDEFREKNGLSLFNSCVSLACDGDHMGVTLILKGILKFQFY